MKGLQSLVRRTAPSSFAYICEKNGNRISDKVVYLEEFFRSFDFGVVICVSYPFIVCADG